MTKSKQPSAQYDRALAARKESEECRKSAEDECCALLRAHPTAAPPSVPRPRHAHEDARDERT
jgi:hypothetical protein